MASPHWRFQMKIRNGFVSNSSSSSFVLCFPNGKPESDAALQNAIFENDTMYPNPYTFSGQPTGYPAGDVIKSLWETIEFSKAKAREQMEHDYASEVWCSISHACRNDSCGDYIMDDGTRISSRDYHMRTLNTFIEKLNKHFPDIKWEEFIKSAIKARKKQEAKEAKAEKLLNALEKEIREKHSLRFAWRNTQEMSRAAAAAYKNDQEDFYKKEKELLYNNPRYKSAQAKLDALWQIDRSDDSPSKVIAKKLADIFFIENKGAYGVVEISDNDGSMKSAMEHGTLFHRIPHVRFSHH